MSGRDITQWISEPADPDPADALTIRYTQWLPGDNPNPVQRMQSMLQQVMDTMEALGTTIEQTGEAFSSMADQVMMVGEEEPVRQDPAVIERREQVAIPIRDYTPSPLPASSSFYQRRSGYTSNSSTNYVRIRPNREI